MRGRVEISQSILCHPGFAVAEDGHTPFLPFMKRFLLPLFAVVVLTLASLSIVRTQPQQLIADPPAPPPRSDFAERVAAVGLVEASSENISLSAHISGVVEKIFVTVGKDVKAGEPLLKQDTRSLEAALAQRRADLAVQQAAVATAQAQARKARAALADVQRHLRFAEAITDARSLSAEEFARRRSAVETAEAEALATEAGITAAEAAVVAAQATLKSVETDVARSTVSAPIDGRVLQMRIHPGEFAAAGSVATPWLVIGNVAPLHVRVDIDEHEAWRVRPNAAAVAQVRGNANLHTPVTFVRFEPLVVPKQSLTGSVTERVDTRVLQAIYRVERSDLPLFVGQQMDVFIDAAGVRTVMTAK